jgi:hypothetical protein
MASRKHIYQDGGSAALLAALDAVERMAEGGLVLAPQRPTRLMLKAACRAAGISVRAAEAAYAAMLDAADTNTGGGGSDLN